MKRLLPLAALTFAAGASCGFPRHGIPGDGFGGDSAVATTTGGGLGGEATGTASSMAGTGGAEVAASASSTSSATASSSTGTVGGVWTRRRKLTLDSGVNSTLTDFPIVVLLGKSQIDYTQTQTYGRDLRFTDDQNNPLDYEIERWVVDDVNPSVLWVRVPLISNKNGASATTLWMYYGNSQAIGAQNIKGVWKDGFVGVWHLSQDDDNLIDSTETTGLAVNHGSTRVAGMVSDARGFTAANGQYIDTLNAMNINRFTVEAWANGTHSPSSSNGPNGPLMRQKNYQIVWDHTDIKYIDGVLFNPNPAGENWRSQSFDMLNSGQWYYLAGTFDGGTLTSFTDGMKKHTTSFSTVDPQTETETAKIGRHAFLTSTTNYFDGVVDEVRISNKARSEDWIAAQNKSMRNGGFVTFGGEESGSYPLP